MSMKTLVQKFNDYIADRLSYFLSMMTTFYIVSILVLIPLFYSQPTSVVAWATYLCSVIFQGIALPVLGYTSRKSSDKSDEMMRELCKMTEEVNRLVKLIEKQQEHISVEVDEILNMEKGQVTSYEVNKTVNINTDQK